MNFSDDVATLAIELPSSWRNMMFCMLAYAVSAWVLYMVLLWRYAVLERKSKIWFASLFSAAFVVSLGTIFVENIFY